MTATVRKTGIAPRRNGAPPPMSPLAEIDIGTLEFWEWDDDTRDGAFATLRRESPITFFEVAGAGRAFPAGAGHWALTTFDDVHHASRHPEIFSSSPTSTSLTDVPVEIAEFFGSMITLDDPRHLRLRTIVNRAFTPKVRGAHRGQRARPGAPAGHRDGRRITLTAARDFVAEVAGPLPLQIICDMMGIPEEDEAEGLPLDDGDHGRRRRRGRPATSTRSSRSATELAGVRRRPCRGTSRPARR